MIPVLHIEQFEKAVNLTEVYANDLAVHLRRNSELVYTAHKHDFYLCVFFSKGTGVHEIDFNSFPIYPGSVFFLKPGQTHLWKFIERPEGLIFFHTKEFFELGFTHIKIEQFPFFSWNGNPPHLHLQKEEMVYVESSFKNIYEEYLENRSLKEQKIRSLIHLLYVDLSRLYTSRADHQLIESNTYLATLQKLNETIQENFKQQKSVSFYADQLHITPKHLNRITAATLGKTPSNLINERLLLEAKRQLVHSNATLSAIATDLGFDDNSYFSKVFVRRVGVTPSAFRKAYKNLLK